MYYDIELTPQEEDELIEMVAKKIHEYGMETAAILLLESSKPLVWIGGEMGRFFITPFVPIVSDEWGVKSEKFFLTFEKRSNIEKLLTRLEQLTKEEEEKKKKLKEEEKKLKKDKKSSESEAKPNEVEPETDENLNKEKKKGWRKYF